MNNTEHHDRDSDGDGSGVGGRAASCELAGGGVSAPRVVPAVELVAVEWRPMSAVTARAALRWLTVSENTDNGNTNTDSASQQAA
ncbi:hypothetical protein FDG2_4254 [Candidatus Protofrankia californiensis]|uniref:Uncharacterized protein n=1 Tax=Candidatus Protofrankia californiensis TaxID=1839754 RepID=A0A1C3P4E3_9ACTN|nr:hypothetical protein FDG2_4254 [Candidatus Protofrankia californiensis]